MKKVLCSILIILSSLLVAILYYSSLRGHEESYSTIPQARSYIYHPNEKMSFEVYCSESVPYISYLELNQYSLLYDGNTYTLQNVSCEILQQGDLYLLIIYSDMIRPLNSLFYGDIVMEILNSKYKLKLNMGSLSILDASEYRLLNVDSLYASYSFINKELHLVGINIKFHDSYKELQQLKVGEKGFGCLSYSLKNVQAKNELQILELVPKYTIPMKAGGAISLESSVYFIPIGYEELSLIHQGYLTMLLDGVLYYLETFDFILNEIDYRDYKSLEEGLIIYDRA